MNICVKNVITYSTSFDIVTKFQRLKHKLNKRHKYPFRIKHTTNGFEHVSVVTENTESQLKFKFSNLSED